MLVGIQLSKDLVLAADLAGLVAVDDLGAEVVDAAAAEVYVDDGADVGAVKAGDQSVQDVDVSGVTGGVDIFPSNFKVAEFAPVSIPT